MPLIRLNNNQPKQHRPKLRIGIYAGAFDPVHAGHVSFALQALQVAGLDQIIFMPERRPRDKPGVEHYAHRVAMLKKALRPHAALAVMEAVDRHYTVARTLPQLQVLFPGSTLVYLMGSDAALTVPGWPHAKQLLASGELVVGVRSEHRHGSVEAAIDEWDIQPQKLTVIDSYAPQVSSAAIRQALRINQEALGLLSSVKRYARQEWLYVSPGSAITTG